MWQSRHRIRTFARGLVDFAPRIALVVSLLALLSSAEMVRAEPLKNPVEELRYVLGHAGANAYRGSLRNPKLEAERQEKILAAISHFKYLGDVAAGLTLEDWIFFPGADIQNKGDLDAWRKLADTFVGGIRKYLQNGDLKGNDPSTQALRADRQAAAALVVRSLGELSRENKTKFLLDPEVLAKIDPVLVDLAANSSVEMRVRMAAVQALGKINPLLSAPTVTANPEDPAATLKAQRQSREKGREHLVAAVNAITSLLSPDVPAAVRRAAAKALDDLPSSFALEGARSLTTEVGVMDESDQLFGFTTIIKAAQASFTDPDAEVRLAAIAAVILPTRAEDEFLVTTRFEVRLVASPDITDEAKLKAYQSQLDELRNDAERQYFDCSRALGKASGTRADMGATGLGDLVADPNNAVCLRALDALRQISLLYLRLIAQAENTAPAGGEFDEVRLPARRMRMSPIRLVHKVDLEKQPDQQVLAGLQASLPMLVRALLNPCAQDRLDAMETLELLALEIGRYESRLPPGDPRRITDAIVRTMEDPNTFVRWVAARTVSKLDRPDPGTAVPMLARILEETDIDLQKVAAKTLATYGPEAVAALPALIQALEKGDADLKVVVMNTIEAIGTQAYSAIPAITGDLQSDKPEVRRRAAELLGRFGPMALGSIPELRRVRNDPVPAVRRAASEAIINIKGQQPETLPLPK